MEGQREKAWVKKGNPYPLIKAANIKRLPTRLKTRLFQGLCKGHGWVTHARIDENPAIRGHDLYFDKTCQWKPHLETRNGRRKRFEIMTGGCDVTLQKSCNTPKI